MDMKRKALKLRENFNKITAHQTGGGWGSGTGVEQWGRPGVLGEMGSWILAQDIGFMQKLTRTGQNQVALQPNTQEACLSQGPGSGWKLFPGDLVAGARDSQHSTPQRPLEMCVHNL